ncbi:MAG: PIN domain-containing protein [Elusimicrobiota bacterium]|jgi:predicted nucleic acid-binding protein|nr:PIN domain-containing protein [Elusimicrobiota bacterium]
MEIIRKFKVYLDTSVISYLSQDDTPEKMKETLDFWDAVKTGLFDVFISTAVIEEINKCPNPKRGFMLERLSEIDYVEIKVSQEVNAIARQIIDEGILPPKARFDSFHIAAAIAAGCHYIASWNMKHMANVKTNRDMRLLTIKGGFAEISIVTPAMFNKGE